LRDVLAQVKPEVLRFFLASSHYRSRSTTPTRASPRRRRVWTASTASRRRRKRAVLRRSAVADPVGEEVAPLLSATARFREAMDDDFNTAAALGHLFDGIRALKPARAGGTVGDRERAGSSSRVRTARSAVRRPRPAAGAFRGAFPGSGRRRRMARRDPRRDRGAPRRADGETVRGADRIRKELEARASSSRTQAGTTWKYKK